MFSFEVNYTGNDKVRNVLNGLSEAFSGQQARSMLRKVGALYLAETENRFEKEYDPDRKKWAALKPSTVRLKGKGYKGRGPGIKGATHRGVWTGDLATSLKMRVEGDSVIIGSDVPYAKPFHYGAKKLKKLSSGINGATAPWGEIPSRRFLGRNNRIDDKVVKLIKAEILKSTGLNVDSIQSAV